MKKILFLILLVPVLCGAEPYYHQELPGSFLGCHSIMFVDCTEDLDFDVRFHWLSRQLYEEEVTFFYQQELHLYDKEVLWSEPLAWDDYSDEERWRAKYLPILRAVKFPEYYYDNQVQE